MNDTPTPTVVAADVEVLDRLDLIYAALTDMAATLDRIVHTLEGQPTRTLRRKGAPQ